MNSKKGDLSVEQLWEIMQLVLVLGFVVTAMLFINQQKNGTFMEKTYLTRDMSLLLSVSLGCQGNLFFAYPKDLSKYDFDFLIKDSYVKIKAKSDKYWTVYPYIMSNEQIFKGFETSKYTIMNFVKNGNGISISDQPDINMKRLNCAKAETYNQEWKQLKITFKTSPDLSMTGMYLGNINNAFESGNEDKNGHIIALYTYNNTNSKDNGAIAYVNGNSVSLRSSQKLACLILNQISDRYAVSHSTIALVELNQINKSSDMFKTLNNDKVAVYISYANANATSNSLMQDQSGIAAQINLGVEQYFTLNDTKQTKTA